MDIGRRVRQRRKHQYLKMEPMVQVLFEPQTHHGVADTVRTMTPTMSN